MVSKGVAVKSARVSAPVPFQTIVVENGATYGCPFGVAVGDVVLTPPTAMRPGVWREQRVVALESSWTRGVKLVMKPDLSCKKFHGQVDRLTGLSEVSTDAILRELRSRCWELESAVGGGRRGR